MDAMFGTVLNVGGGTIDYGFAAHRGSNVNISGGNVLGITARSGSTVNITGGTIGTAIDGVLPWGQISLEAGSELHITGTDLQLDGNPIEGLEPGATVNLRRDDHPYLSTALSGTLADGSPLLLYISNYPQWDSAGWQYGEPAAVTLTAMLPGDFDGNLVVDAADYTVWRDNLGSKYSAGHYAIWRSAFGQTAMRDSVSPQVPEPSTAVMLFCVVGWLMSARVRVSDRSLQRDTVELS
jgi:hypothetical protein